MGLVQVPAHAPQVPPSQVAVQVLVSVPQPLEQVLDVGWFCVGLVQVPVHAPQDPPSQLAVQVLVCVPQPVEQVCEVA